ncbi:MAG: S-layer homology domain-containing protein [Armatimonadetes bacterium]|nr:S-layer homology domain-containing protein [Armatimonadota bacterium]
MGKAFVLLALLLAGSSSAISSGFKDVPKDHWAADSVRVVSEAGIMKGYPDGTFRGDKPVTRYELAVALQAMVEYIQASQKPLVTSSKNVELSPRAHWARRSMDYLKTEGFLPKNSPILTSGDKTVTPTELADAFTSVSARLIELSVSPPGPED